MIYSLVTTLILSFAIMTLAWIFMMRLKNAGVIDLFWVFNVVCLVVFHGHRILGGVVLPSDETTYFTYGIIFLVILWGLRLNGYLFLRFKKNNVDPRYLKIIASWSNFKSLRLLGMAYFQGLIAFIICSPFLFLNPEINIESRWAFVIPKDVLIVLVFNLAIIALILEGIADQQLYRFKQNGLNRDKILDYGLWAICRHPNYFFEWAFWLMINVALALLSNNVLTLLPSIFQLWMLNNLSGVKITESSMADSKAQALKNYQDNTPAFFPRILEKKTTK